MDTPGRKMGASSSLGGAPELPGDRQKIVRISSGFVNKLAGPSDLCYRYYKPG